MPTSFIAKLVPNNYQYKPNTFRTFDYHGVKLKLDIHDYVSHWLYFDFKDVSHGMLMQLVKENDVVLDIGTNYGSTILQFAALIGEKGRAYGFEPDPINFNICNQNLALNNFSNLEVANLGLGSKKADLLLVVDTESNRGGNRISTNTEGKNFSQIQVVTLDNWSLDKKISKIDLIKIDVEGYEMEVLKGAEQTLLLFSPILFIELDDENLKLQQSSAKELVTFLLKLGYVISHAETKESIHEQSNFSHCHYDIVCKKNIS